MNDSGLSVAHFRGLIKETCVQMEELCSSWDKKLLCNSVNYDENFCGQIRSVVGQARILANERGRLTQFKNLVDNYEFGLGEKETTIIDLQGFWEMIDVQIQEMLDKFQYLENVESGVHVDSSTKHNSSTSTPTSVSQKMSSHTLNNRRKLTKAVSSKDLKAFKAAKKRELSKLDSKMKVLHLSPPSTQLQVPICKSFNGGFFNIKSPVRPSSPPEAPPCSPKQRNRFDSSKSNEFLRQAVLTTSSIKNPTSPYMVMKVSSVGKRDLRVVDVKQRLFIDDK
uniref:Microtubuleassociated protein futschlike [Aplysia californica] n=1 Tax=Lepeophtheirus salmonis TaxID=72036 RepID=A0A0K2TVP6_LEPSM